MVILFLVVLCRFIVFCVLIQPTVITLLSTMTKHAGTITERPWAGSIFPAVYSVAPSNSRYIYLQVILSIM